MVTWEVPPSRRFAFIVVLLFMMAGLLVSGTGHFRIGGYLLALSMALAATFRATLPEKYCLGLLVRTRSVDVLVAAGFAIALAATVAVVPG